MKLYLIRHGKTIDHYNGKRQSYDSELHQESILLLKDRKDFKDIQFDALYSSPQKRALQTTEALFPEQQYNVLDFIYEYKPPSFMDSLSMEEAGKWWEQHLEDIYNPEWRPEDGESFNDIIARINQLIDYLTEHHDTNDTIAIVSHGNYIKHFASTLIAPQTYSARIWADFARLITLVNGGYFLMEFNKNKRKGYLLHLRNDIQTQ